MTPIVIRDATVITMDAQRRVVRADVRVDGGVVTDVGTGLRGDDIIEAGGDILLPGLVNAHTHSAMTLLRGLGDDLPLEEWLRTRVWPFEARLSRADVEAGTKLAVLEMLRGGTTCFNDMYFFADATAEAAASAAMRAHVGATLIDFDTPEHKMERQEAAARAFVARWKGHDLVTPTLAPHATYTVGDETLARAKAIQQESGCRVHTHCSETRFEVQDVLEKRGARPVEVLRRAGLIEGAVLAHCGWVTKEEIRTMATAKASAVHCPVSNLKLATGGTMPFEEMRAAGQNVAMGTDGAASNNALDMLETVKLGALVQKQHRWDARAGSAAAMLEAATLGGLRALGLPSSGIAPGAPADLALVSTKGAHMRPLHDPTSAIVYGARASDVRLTMVAGRALYRDGAFATLDADKVIATAERAAQALLGSSAR